MKKGSKLTRVGLTVLICTILLIIAIGFLAFQKIRNEACRLVCSVNLKGLGTAMTVYANDYNDNYPQLPGNGPWSKRLGFDYNMKNPDFSKGGAQEKTSRTITSSLYLLVRETDVSPKSFICPQSEQQVFPWEGQDLVNLWDFGYTPQEYVSYSYHNPYGRFPATEGLADSFAIAADANPWFDTNGDIVAPGTQSKYPQILSFSNPETWKFGNSQNHKNPFGKNGQNILYADGEMAFTQSPNRGINNDNIYTFWSIEKNPTEQDIQGGTAPTGRTPGNDAKSKDDSFLAI